MTIQTEPFDAARYLDTPDSQAELLSDALETGDVGYLVDAIGVVARARGIADIAAEASIAPQALYDALHTVLAAQGDVAALTTLARVAKELTTLSAAQPVS